MQTHKRSKIAAADPAFFQSGNLGDKGGYYWGENYILEKILVYPRNIMYRL